MSVEEQYAAQPALGATFFQNVKSIPQLLSAPLIAFCVIYAIAAFSFAPADYLNMLGMNMQRVGRITMAAFLVSLCCIALLERKNSPIEELGQFLVHRGVMVVAYQLVFVTSIAAFSTFKINIPNIVPFYADPYLADFDQWLHGGIAPWEFTHQLPAIFGGAIDFIYSRVWFIVLIGLFTYSCLFISKREMKRYMAAMVLTYGLLGTVLAISFSSVGPIFYDRFYEGGRFAGLLNAIDSNENIFFVPQYANYLYANYITQDALFGTGISAMPSLHVGFAVLTAWYFTSFNRFWKIAGWSYAAFIGFGSVYTGWHYAADGYLAAILVSLLWIALSRVYKLPLTSRDPDAKAEEDI